MDPREREAKTHEQRGDALLASSPTQALNEYITAIELFLAVASNTSAPKPQSARCRTACRSLMIKAESLKRQIKEPTRRQSTFDRRSSKVLSQQPEEKLSVKEETILLKSSKIDGGKHPPLKPGTVPVIDESGGLFTDPSGLLALSRRQEAQLGEWQRPCEFLDQPCVIDKDGCGGMYLAQDIITDCSLVASLCAAAAWEVKHHAQVVTNRIFPPAVSKFGKYIVVLNLNGCRRQIVIDDYLPQGRDGRSLHVMSKTSPNLIYPALIEKAFLKVFGGYDFPGSNSATDLYILTGWIPEVVYLQLDELNLEGTWNKVLRAWMDGDVLVTVGTGSLTTAEEEEFGLVGDHNYSVFGIDLESESHVDIVDRNNRRLLQIRNPWSKRGIPKSTFSTIELQDALSEKSALTPDESLGTFWIDYASLSQMFKTLYLNWNPALFLYSYNKHFSFIPNGSDFDVGRNGQYTISTQGPGDVWILVERHYFGKSEGWEGYIGLAVFSGNERIYSYSGATYRTEYCDGNYSLLKIVGLPANQPHTILVLANDKKSAPPQPQRFFTLTVYSNFPVSIADPTDSLPYEVCVQGIWENGVSYKSLQSTFIDNPQWRLVVPDTKPEKSTARIFAILESQDSETAVNVTIAWSAGRRLARLANQDILCQSGEYSPHHASIRARTVKPSTQYTLIASRFEDLSPVQNQFTVILRSDVPVSLTALRAEWAGKSRKTIGSRWDAGENFKRFILAVQRLTSFSVKLSTPDAKFRPFVRLSLRESDYDDEEGEELAGSGEQHSDLGLGEPCSVEGFDLVGGEEYVLWVERLGGEEDDDEGGEFILDFLADGDLEPIEI